MKNTGHIFALVALFLGTAFALGKFGFWEAAGIEHPEGLVFQGMLFFSLYILLKTFLFEPYLNVLDERDRQTVGKLKWVEESQVHARAMLAKYEEGIANARLNAIRERERMALEAESLEKETILRAKSESFRYLENQVKENFQATSVIKSTLSGELPVWTNEIIKKVTISQFSTPTFERVAATRS